MVVKESSRLHSVVGRAARISVKPMNILGYIVPAGTTILPNFHTMHVNPKYWENPFEFKPERFLQTAGCFMPFGAGPMNCVGQRLALIEIKIVVLKLWLKFDFALIPDEKYVPITTLTYGLKNGLNLLVSHRKQ